MDFIKQAQERVLSHQEDQALLKAYIAEWRKFFTQCGYLPMPFGQLETALQGKTTTSVQKGRPAEDSVVRKLMLDSWNKVGRRTKIYCLNDINAIKQRASNVMFSDNCDDPLGWFSFSQVRTLS